MTVTATLDLAAATARRWDVLVLGAGPAGAMAARALAQQGHAVLLVDRAAFPRWKVCGACLSGEALAALAAAGLRMDTAATGAVPLHGMELWVAGRATTIPLSRRVALSRYTLDAALIEAAVGAGAHFLPETWGRVDAVLAAGRQVALRQHGHEAVATAQVVVAADGLGGTACAADADVRPSVRADSRIGAGTVIDAPPAYVPGTIFMACGAGGYVGLVRIEDGRLNIAGAFDATAVRRHGGIGRLATAIVAAAGLPALPALATAPWRGTPALTRRARRPAGQRLFLAGDAAGYVEPFTGDGMAAALAAGVAVARVASRAVRRWEPALAAEWSASYRRLVVRRQWACGWLARLLRQPRLLAAGAVVVRRLPILLAPVLHFMEGPGSASLVPAHSSAR